MSMPPRPPHGVMEEFYHRLGLCGAYVCDARQLSFRCELPRGHAGRCPRPSNPPLDGRP